MIVPSQLLAEFFRCRYSLYSCLCNGGLRQLLFGPLDISGWGNSMLRTLLYFSRNLIFLLGLRGKEYRRRENNGYGYLIKSSAPGWGNRFLSSSITPLSICLKTMLVAYSWMHNRAHCVKRYREFGVSIDSPNARFLSCTTRLYAITRVSSN